MPSSSQGNASLIVASDRLRPGSKSGMKGHPLRLLERELLASSGYWALLVAITAARLPTVTPLCGSQKAAASIDRLGVVRLGRAHLQAPPRLRQRCSLRLETSLRHVLHRIDALHPCLRRDRHACRAGSLHMDRPLRSAVAPSMKNPLRAFWQGVRETPAGFFRPLCVLVACVGRLQAPRMHA